MTGVTCPGLPAHWTNGWMAAVGATVLDSRIRLHEIDPVAALVASWPDRSLLTDLPIAED